MFDYIGLFVNLLVGVLGGAAWCLVAQKAWGESYEWIRRVALGAIVGLFLFLVGKMAISGGDDALLVISVSYLAVDWFTALTLKVGE